MHKLANLSDQERRRLIHDFIDHAFDGLDVDDAFLATMRNAMPELPEDPAPEQIDAWVELAELVQDADFRAGMRKAAVDQLQARTEVGAPAPEDARRLAELIMERTTLAREAGIDPASDEARPTVDELVARSAELSGREDGPEFRSWLLERMEIGNDSRHERYWRLIAVINGWPAPSMGPAVEWLIAALRVRR